MLVDQCRGTGGGNPGIMGVGRLQEAGEDRAGDGIPRERESGEIGNNFATLRNFAQ